MKVLEFFLSQKKLNDRLDAEVVEKDREAEMLEMARTFDPDPKQERWQWIDESSYGE